MTTSRARLWILVHAVVVLLPLVGMVVRGPWDVRLWGVELPPLLGTPSFASWWTERLQPQFQLWFEARIGLRAAMVRTDNTLQNFVFGDAKPGSYVVVGEQGMPFAGDDVRYLGTPRRDLPIITARVEALTALLASVHRKLAARGKALVVVISPSKSTIYPEYVPRRWRVPGPAERSDLAEYEALRAGLVRSGVPFGDGHAIFASAPVEERELLFAWGGRHWTSVGACRVLRGALASGPVTPTCEWRMMPADRSRHGDFDLLCLENLWGTDVGLTTVPIAGEPAPVRDPSVVRPRLLLAGTSFMWMLADLLRPLVDKPVALFYNNTFFDLTAGRRLSTADPKAADWAEYVLERDLYVIDLLETFAHHDEMRTFLTELDRRLE